MRLTLRDDKPPGPSWWVCGCERGWELPCWGKVVAFLGRDLALAPLNGSPEERRVDLGQAHRNRRQPPLFSADPSRFQTVRRAGHPCPSPPTTSHPRQAKRNHTPAHVARLGKRGTARKLSTIRVEGVDLGSWPGG